MKKRFLAIMLTICVLFCAFSCVVSAAPEITVSDIIVETRICPGKTIEQVIDAPAIVGNVYQQGWMIQTPDGVWVPYSKEPIAEDAGTFRVKYFAADESGDIAYSNECVVTAEHNPAGSYEYDGLDHWRVCADCKGRVDVDGHTHLGEGATATQKVCTVCGHIRTSQWTGLLAFWEWIMALLGSLIG